jgi:ParB family chromosome partitioning protein
MSRNGNRRAASAAANSVGKSDATENTRQAASTQAPTRRIDEITVGERHRRDMGDIAGLAASMAELGLLHPIVVRPAGTLIAGERRLRAARMLGWTEIGVNVVDLEDIVRGEFAENAVRKEFTLSEAVAVMRALRAAALGDGGSFHFARD